MDSVLGIKGFDLKRTLEMDPEFLDTEGEHEHDPSVSSISYKFEGFLNQHKLNRWIGHIIRTMGADLFRYKGVLSIAGVDDKFVFQGVGMLFSGSFVDAKWGPDEPRECRFVFIGKNLDKKALEDGFLACKCTEVEGKQQQLQEKNGDLQNQQHELIATKRELDQIEHEARKHRDTTGSALKKMRTGCAPAAPAPAGARRQ